MPISPEEIKELIHLGAGGLLVFVLVTAVVVLWRQLTSLGKQLEKEREKREELLRESIKTSMSVAESVARMADSIDRWEQGILRNVR